MRSDNRQVANRDLPCIRMHGYEEKAGDSDRRVLPPGLPIIGTAGKRLTGRGCVADTGGVMRRRDEPMRAAGVPVAMLGLAVVLPLGQAAELPLWAQPRAMVGSTVWRSDALGRCVGQAARHVSAAARHWCGSGPALPANPSSTTALTLLPRMAPTVVDAGAAPPVHLPLSHLIDLPPPTC